VWFDEDGCGLGGLVFRGMGWIKSDGNLRCVNR
jgi:hypothetical protein